MGNIEGYPVIIKPERKTEDLTPEDVGFCPLEEESKLGDVAIRKNYFEKMLSWINESCSDQKVMSDLDALNKVLSTDEGAGDKIELLGIVRDILIARQSKQYELAKKAFDKLLHDEMQAKIKSVSDDLSTELRLMHEGGVDDNLDSTIGAVVGLAQSLYEQKHGRPYLSPEKEAELEESERKVGEIEVA